MACDSCPYTRQTDRYMIDKPGWPTKEVQLCGNCAKDYRHAGWYTELVAGAPSGAPSDDINGGRT
jgi:hypothetical protein